MDAINPGDTVECIDASPDRASGQAVPLVEGALYVVEYVWQTTDERDGLQGSCVDLVGVPRLPDDIAYGIHRFSPIRKPSRGSAADVQVTYAHETTYADARAASSLLKRLEGE